MNCPKCAGKPLFPTTPVDGLPALGCKHCNGCLIGILSYRYWLDHVCLADADRCKAAVQTEDSKNVLQCPKCSHLMSKYRISDTIDNHIDLCQACAEFWLDGNEWPLLETLNLEKSVPALFSDSWQRSILEKKTRDVVEQQLEVDLGRIDYQKLKDFVAWINAHKLSSRLWSSLYKLKNMQ